MKNPYHAVEGCVERLHKEYTKHKNIIVAVDFDNTIYDYHHMNTDFSDVLGILKQCTDLGFHIVIFTAAEVKRWDYMKEYCEKFGVKVSSINKNPIDLPYGHNGKIYYNILLDDRAGLGQSLEILSKLITKIK